MTPQTTTEILIGALAFQGILIVVLDWRRSTWKRRATGRDPMGLAERIALTEGDLIATRADRDATEAALTRALQRVDDLEDLEADLDRLDAEVAPRSNAAGPVDAAIDALGRADAAMAAAGGKIVTLRTSLAAVTAQRDEARNAITHRNMEIHDLTERIEALEAIPDPPIVRSVLTAWLAARGYDGLVCTEGDPCGCDLADLVPCDGPCDNCRPGYKGPDPDGDCHFLIYPDRAGRDAAVAEVENVKAATYAPIADAAADAAFTTAADQAAAPAETEGAP